MNIKQDKKEVKVSGKRYDPHNLEILLNRNLNFHIQYTKVYESFNTFSTGSLIWVGSDAPNLVLLSK